MPKSKGGRKMQPAAADPVSRMKRAVRRAEASAFDDKRRTTKGVVEDVGTGFTVLKLQSPPIGQLREGKRIGGVLYRIGADEERAADDFRMGYETLTNRLWIRPQTLQKLDSVRAEPDLERLVREGKFKEAMPWPAKRAGPVARYQAFANHWSARSKSGDPTLGILIAAVVDERPIRTIAYDEGIGYLRALRAIVAGLRDYAARAGFVTGTLAVEWKEEAAAVFHVDHPDLAMAKIRAQNDS